LVAFLTTRYHGQSAFGEVYGLLFAAFILGSSAGQYAADASFDSLGSYAPAFATFGVALVAAAMLVSRLGPYVYPSQRDLAVSALGRGARGRPDARLSDC
jgi:hypothetical protein